MSIALWSQEHRHPPLLHLFHLSLLIYGLNCRLEAPPLPAPLDPRGLLRLPFSQVSKTKPTTSQPEPGKTVGLNLPYHRLPQCAIPNMEGCGCLFSLLVLVYHLRRETSMGIQCQEPPSILTRTHNHILSPRSDRLSAVLTGDFPGVGMNIPPG